MKRLWIDCGVLKSEPNNTAKKSQNATATYKKTSTSLINKVEALQQKVKIPPSRL